MKNLKFSDPAYDEAEKRLLYMKTLAGGRRLDIVAHPINPSIGSIPSEVAEAFGSVLLNVTDLREDVLLAPDVWSDMYEGYYSESVHEVVLDAAVTQINERLPELKDDERTAYVCPIVASSGVGYRHGYVVAWEEADALTVAEFMAGGRAEIYLELESSGGAILGGDLLGDLSYLDVLCDTDTYRRIVAGEEFALAMETHLGIEAPEPEDTEFPGAGILSTFTKVA